MSLTSEEKKKFLRALEEDDEFRYAIAGLVGYREILARLEEHDRKFEQVMARLEEHDRKFEQVMARLEEHDRKFEEILAEIKGIKEDLKRMGGMVERFSLTLEEEGREVLSWLLRKEGIDIELESVEIGGVQYDIYGESDDLVIIGEVKTRLSAKRVEEFAERIEKLLKIERRMRNKRVIKVMYAMVVLPAALEEARARGITVVTVKGVISGDLKLLAGG